MPQYLRLADNIYKRFLKENKFNNPLQDYLNLIVKQLRKDLKDTDLRLKYNFIDFLEGFQANQSKGHLFVDVSLVPNYKEKDEFLLWLAGFIEKITDGGVKRLPPIIEDIPPDFSFEKDINKLLKNKSEDLAKTIDSYFKSEEFNDFINN
jgi:hypothetical protein